MRVANTAAEAWTFEHLTRTTDRDDGCGSPNWRPSANCRRSRCRDPATRQRRALIAFRQELVGRRVACQNRIRSRFAAVGLALLDHRALWVALAAKRALERIDGKK